MKIHTDYLNEVALLNASRVAGVTLARQEWRGSRTHQGAWDVILSGSGAHRSQYAERDTPAATWDEWGIFLRGLYRIDPNARCGGRRNPVYADAEHFWWTTDGRFDRLVPADQHRLHRWSHGGSATRSYVVRTCRCGAMCRWLVDVSWAEWQESLGLAPEPTQRERLERLTADVEQLRQDADAEYPYDPAADRERLAQLQRIPPMAPRFDYDAGTMPAEGMPPAAPLWTPRRERVRS